MTSELLSYSFYCLVYLSHEKVEDVSSIITLFLVLWVLTSRESGGRLNPYHTFRLLWVLKSRESGGRLSYERTLSIALDTQVKRKCRTSQLLSYFFYCFGYSSQEKVEDVSTLSYFIGCSGYSSQEKVENVSAVIILFILLWVFKSRENEGRLNYYNTFYMDVGAEVTRKWRKPQLLSYFF